MVCSADCDSRLLSRGLGPGGPRILHRASAVGQESSRRAARDPQRSAPVGQASPGITRHHDKLYYCGTALKPMGQTSFTQVSRRALDFGATLRSLAGLKSAHYLNIKF